MSIYVGPIQAWGFTLRGDASLTSHLWADTEDELLDMAEKIGFPFAYLRRSPSGVLFGELSERYRTAAIQKGAVQLDHAEAMKKWMSLGKVKIRSRGVIREVRR